MIPTILLLVMAPVPPEPKVLTEEMLPGRWAYMYQGQFGWMELDKYGRYTAQLGSVFYYGEWYVTAHNELVLMERTAAWQPKPTRYIFELKLKCRGRLLEGKCNGGPVNLERINVHQ